MRIIRRIALFSILIVLLAVGALGFYSYELKRRADNLVRISYELSERENPPTVEEVRQQLGSSLTQPKPCIPDGCGYDVLISNRILSRLHLAPYTALRSSFWATNGIIQSNDLDFWTMPSASSIAVEIKYCRRCALFSVDPGNDRSQLFGVGYVTIDSGATPDTKRMALAIDTGCLTRFHGCSGIARLLPTVWQETPQGMLHCKIPNRDGIFENAGPR